MLPVMVCHIHQERLLLFFHNNACLKNNKAIVNFFNDAENKSFDYRQSLLVKHKHLKPSNDIVILAIDNASYEYILDNYGEWPISRKVYADIIHLIEKATIGAMNSLLKFLEEPVDDVVAIITTQNISKVLATIISRCQLIRLKDYSSYDLENLLINNGYRVTS